MERPIWTRNEASRRNKSRSSIKSQSSQTNKKSQLNKESGVSAEPGVRDSVEQGVRVLDEHVSLTSLLAESRLHKGELCLLRVQYPSLLGHSQGVNVIQRKLMLTES